MVFDMTASTNSRKLMLLNPEFPKDITTIVTRGQTASVTFEAKILEHGRPADYTYQWYVNETPVQGATDAVYIRDVSESSDSEKVYCAVSNKKGTLNTRVANLTVLYTPVLNESYPSNATVDTGKSVTCSVTIKEDGNPASYTYQWYKNGSKISGATSSSYTFTPNAVGSTTFYCEVTNSAGTVTSRTATITAKNELVLIPGTSFSNATKVNQNVTITRNSDNTYTVKVPINGGAGISVDVTKYKTMEIYASYNAASGTKPKIGLFSAINPSNFITGYDGGSAAATVNTTYDISSVTGSKYFGLYNTTAGDENETKVFQLYRVVFKE